MSPPFFGFPGSLAGGGVLIDSHKCLPLWDLRPLTFLVFYRNDRIDLYCIKVKAAILRPPLVPQFVIEPHNEI